MCHSVHRRRSTFREGSAFGGGLPSEGVFLGRGLPSEGVYFVRVSAFIGGGVCLLERVFICIGGSPLPICGQPALGTHYTGIHPYVYL